MKRILSGVAATAAALALAGCARSSTETATVSEPFEWTAAAALGVTGGLLLIPAITLFILCAVHYYTIRPHEDWKPLTRNLLIAALVTTAVAVLLWIVATWMAVTA